MLEHITLLTYLYTRLDMLIDVVSVGLGLSLAIIVLSIITFFSGSVSCYTAERQDRFEKKWAPVCKRVVISAIVSVFFFGLLKVLIPTKNDALLIAGVTAGVQVAEKTVDTMSKSELVGKVFDIVDQKVDNVLADMKKQNAEIKDKNVKPAN